METELHLNVIKTYKGIYRFSLGLSGQYINDSGAIEAVAVAMVFSCIKRYFALDITIKGTSQFVPLENMVMQNVVKSVRVVETVKVGFNKPVFKSEVLIREKCRA